MFKLEPFQRDAKEFAMQVHTHLIHPLGGRWRFEPLPNQLTSAIEMSIIRGRLAELEDMLTKLENTPYESKEVFIGDLHLRIMKINNDINQRFGLGKKIDGVEFFTDKYSKNSTQPNYSVIKESQENVLQLPRMG